MWKYQERSKREVGHQRCSREKRHVQPNFLSSNWPLLFQPNNQSGKTSWDVFGEFCGEFYFLPVSCSNEDDNVEVQLHPQVWDELNQLHNFEKILKRRQPLWRVWLRQRPERLMTTTQQIAQLSPSELTNRRQLLSDSLCLQRNSGNTLRALTVTTVTRSTTVALFERLSLS